MPKHGAGYHIHDLHKGKISNYWERYFKKKKKKQEEEEYEKKRQSSKLFPLTRMDKE